MPARERMSRRRFLRQASAAAVGAVAFPYVVPSSVLGGPGKKPPSELTTMGFIGVGGRGGALLTNFIGLGDCQILAVCDPKQGVRDAGRGYVNKLYGKDTCAAYADFRELTARADLDAVAVATPDHWHVLQALSAVRAGKDVYCEKPLAVSMAESTALRRAVHQRGAVLQFGTQERSAFSTRFACELVLNGRIGKVSKITVGSRFSEVAPNFPPAPVPADLDYDLWLGPAPWAPYSPQRVTNGCWFHMSDYSRGFISGCGVHTVDMAQWGNGTDRTGPLEIEGVGEFPPDGICDCATGWDVNMKFANGVTMNFTDGKRNPLGVLFQGDKGKVFVLERHLGGTVDAEPKSLLKEKFGPDEIHLTVSNNHQQNFLDAVRTRTEPVAPIDVAVRSDALCQLSDIAIRLGRKLKWDPEKETFPGDDEANRMLVRPMREAWRL